MNDRCEACGATYTNVQHPAKPLGVVVMRTCNCEIVVRSIENGTVILLVPPKKDEGS